MWFETPPHPNTPLAGLKVLELARVLAGPWAGQILADLGADVIKVESPEGDTTRTWGPPWIERENGDREAAYYHATNRGKRGVVADFRNERDLARIRELAASADVVIENFKTGSLAKFGLDYASLAEANPALVYCSITGFGHTGPRAHEPGYDVLIQAMSGFMSLTGEPEGQPMKMGVSISDLACGMWATNAIQAALLMRHRTGPMHGQGQHIDMALLDCSVSLLANQAMYYMATGEQPMRAGNGHAVVSAYGVYPASDGPVILAPANDKLFGELLRALGLNRLLGDERFIDNGARLANRAALDAEIEAATSEMTRDELLSRCAEAGVPAGPINNLDAVFGDPQVRSRGMALDLPGALPGLRTPFRFSDAELALSEPSPTKGQHQDEF
ncbi:CaiB/BaiF CoA transferase family protein [Altererythrobacter sp. MF3-039]|uniref:CaiB/BaiF CoA transferase family protein n=1 Tax=Altererythrobacter sp. MF3-039 TaxID=3252901 RepID=UPI00390CBAD4